MSSLTLPLWLCSNPAAEGLDGVTQRPWAAVICAVVGVGEAIWRFAVCLAQQGVEAVVEAGTEASISGVAGAVQRAIVDLLGRRQNALALVVVVGGGQVEVVLL